MGNDTGYSELTRRNKNKMRKYILKFMNQNQKLLRCLKQLADIL